MLHVILVCLGELLMKIFCVCCAEHLCFCAVSKKAQCFCVLRMAALGFCVSRNSCVFLHIKFFLLFLCEIDMNILFFMLDFTFVFSCV